MYARLNSFPIPLKGLLEYRLKILIMDSLANVLIFCRFLLFLKDPFSRLFTVLFSIASSIFYNKSFVCLKSHISEAALMHSIDNTIIICLLK